MPCAADRRAACAGPSSFPIRHADFHCAVRAHRHWMGRGSPVSRHRRAVRPAGRDRGRRARRRHPDRADRVVDQTPPRHRAEHERAGLDPHHASRMGRGARVRVAGAAVAVARRRGRPLYAVAARRLRGRADRRPLASGRARARRGARRMEAADDGQARCTALGARADAREGQPAVTGPRRVLALALALALAPAGPHVAAPGDRLKRSARRRPHPINSPPRHAS
ncbi:hypothetical protein EMIT0158MI4_100190 [Burkholderia ambifaria]